MAFMAPFAQYFKREELIESLGYDQSGKLKTLRCVDCGKHRPHFNAISANSCIRCTPPEQGWYARLSARSCLDATDWHGPYATSEEALGEVRSFYEVDENGDSLDDEN